MLAIRPFLSRTYRRAVGLERRIEAAVTLPVGQISLTESRFLGELARDLASPGPIIEIGTLFGWSTRVMALFKTHERKLITVDAYVWNPLGLPPDVHHRSTSTILTDAVCNHNVQIIRQDKDVFYAEYSGPPPALVFLDADHSYEATKADIKWARKAGATIIAIHDYASHSPAVVQAVDDAGGAARVVETIAVLR